MPLDLWYVNPWFDIWCDDSSRTVDKLQQFGCIGHVWKDKDSQPICSQNTHEKHADVNNLVKMAQLNFSFTVVMAVNEKQVHSSGCRSSVSQYTF